MIMALLGLLIIFVNIAWFLRDRSGYNYNPKLDVGKTYIDYKMKKRYEKNF